MASEKRLEFAKLRNRLLHQTGTKEFICARCGKFGKSVNLHHIEELIQGGENELSNLIPLCGDCHAEWDVCADVGMTFGEFLVSLPFGSMQIAAYIGLFKSPEPIGNTLENIYALQFTGRAFKWEAKRGKDGSWIDYWRELERQNSIFNAYPYSDHTKMIELFGTMYKTLPAAAFKEYTEKKTNDALRKDRSAEPA